jgi:hypothetical protein
LRSAASAGATAVIAKAVTKSIGLIERAGMATPLLELMRTHRLPNRTPRMGEYFFAGRTS